MAVDTDLLDQALLNGGMPYASSDSRTRRVLLIAVAVILLGVAGYLVYLATSPSKPTTLASGPIVTMPGQPAGGMVVSLDDGHYLDVEVSLQTTNVTDSTELSADGPQFANAVISVFGGMGYSYLQSGANQTAAKAILLQDFQQILGKKDGLPQLSAIYYTEFLLQ
jgi:flagellar basal body-associated protein FliL